MKLICQFRALISLWYNLHFCADLDIGSVLFFIILKHKACSDYFNF